MRLAILMANTDDSAFAKAHPDDGAKFSALLHRVRPDWQFEVFDVKDGVFPQDLDFDGILITGSPASVHDGTPWITELEALVRRILAARVPLYGACFGHQIIARALKAPVGDNPDGWSLGRIETEALPEGVKIPMYAAHKEQVLALPEGARLTARTPGCPIAGFAIGRHVLTTQYHPEMDRDFIAALLVAFQEGLGKPLTERALASLGTGTDLDALGASIARFFEQAR